MNERNNNESRNGGRNENAAVDMVATAQAVQQAGDAWRGPGAVKLIAPAMVNLFLGIGARREDGYHEAVSFLHAIALHDVLYLRRAAGRPSAGEVGAQAAAAAGTSVPRGTAGASAARDAAGTSAARDAAGTSDAADDATALAGPAHNVSVRMECIAREGLAPLPVAASENIVFRAIDALAHEVGRTEPDFLEVRLEKHIPHQAGLGGGSSDAAAALLGMARLWEIGPDDPALERVAHRLGSDVAFFLQGGCACFEGTGERFAHALEPMKRSLVLVRPVKGVSTAEAYRMFDEAPLPIDEGCLQQAKQAACASDVPLFNNLASASERLMPELDEVKAWLQSQPGVEGVLLCGSGSTTFAVVNGVNEACRLTAAAQARGWWARSTTFGSLRAAIVP